MNKKAEDILGAEVLRLVTAVICIALLIFLAYQLYGIFLARTQLEQARASLDAIIGKANALTDGETLTYLITAPKDWNIISYSEQKKICFCPIDAGFEFNNCNRAGICKENSGINFDMRFYDFDKHIVVESRIDFYGPRTIYLSKESGIVYFRDYKKGEYDNIISKIINLDLKANNVKTEIGNIINDAQNEKGRKIGVILWYKDKGQTLFIPSEFDVRGIGRNFVVPGDKENTAIFLVVERKGNG